MFSFVPLSQGLWGWAKNTPGPGGGGQALVAGHFAPLVPGQGIHRAVGQCADVAAEGARTGSALLPRGRPTRTR